MEIEIQTIDQQVLNMRTRMPFRYGIAELTSLPHLFVSVSLRVDGVEARGIASDGLAPKWFTKNPESGFDQDIGEMMQVIEAAGEHALAAGAQKSVYRLWRAIYDAQENWAADSGLPPLLWGFGVSLVERAIIDAFCQAKGITLAQAVAENHLGLDLADLHVELAGSEPRDWLPSPKEQVALRHTVGLGDPISDAEIPANERVDDCLPQSLAACIEAYGLSRFKIKLGGEVAADVARLGQIAALLQGRSDIAFTLDGNEQYRSVAVFRKMWEELSQASEIAAFLEGLLFVEQPFHRDVALSESLADDLLAWDARPPIIIDESDGALDSARLALAAGYAGTSHKNCKGVIKGIANACLIAHRRQHDSSRQYLMSGEDLCNVGPIAMLQDLAVAAILGIAHVERNGHHYFAGLSMYPQDLQEAVLAAHPDLYHESPAGWPTLTVADGMLSTASILAAPFGSTVAVAPQRFTPIQQWTYASLGLD